MFLKRVWHVGDLSKRAVSAHSFEGNGLSVSLHPTAWRGIARLGSGKLYEMRRRGGQPGAFVDLTATPEALLKRCVRAGFADRGIAWQRSYWDDEMGSEMTQVFSSEQEAELESDGEDSVVEVTVLVPTSKLLRLHAQVPLALTADFAIMATLEEEEPGVDGVWWREVLDPSIHSAPRGAIFQSRLPRWSATEVSWDEAPDR